MAWTPETSRGIESEDTSNSRLVPIVVVTDLEPLKPNNPKPTALEMRNDETSETRKSQQEMQKRKRRALVKPGTS